MRKMDLTRAIYAETGDPLEYPSAIAAKPLFVSGDSFEELRPAQNFSTFATVDGENVDVILRRNGSAPVAGRVAQIAFGAQRNMENIAWKLANYARSVKGEFSRDFIMLPGYLRNADVVACNISSGGHMYSGLLTTREDRGFRKYLLGTKCPVTILLFDERQRQAMHEMSGILQEGETAGAFRCDLATVTVNLDDDVTCEAETYSVSVPFLSLDGGPLAFGAVSTSGRSGYRGMSQRDMFRAINGVIAAEPAVDGVTPIIDSVSRKRGELLKSGEAGRIAEYPLFASVKQKLATEHVLRDDDGKVRRGVEDVYEARSAADSWRFEPLYNPIPKSA